MIIVKATKFCIQFGKYDLINGILMNSFLSSLIKNQTMIAKIKGTRIDSRYIRIANDSNTTNEDIDQLTEFHLTIIRFSAFKKYAGS